MKNSLCSYFLKVTFGNWKFQKKKCFVKGKFEGGLILGNNKSIAYFWDVNQSCGIFA